MYEIEKDVPCPSPRLGAPAKYPWGEMDVGDSIKMPVEDFMLVKSCAYNYGYRHNKRFSARKNGKEGRIWRVA